MALIHGDAAVVPGAVGDRFESTMEVFQYVEQHLAQPALGLRHHRIPNVLHYHRVL